MERCFKKDRKERERERERESKTEIDRHTEFDRLTDVGYSKEVTDEPIYLIDKLCSPAVKSSCSITHKILCQKKVKNTN